MSLYSESDIVRAFNEGRALKNLVLLYLGLYKALANGANGVTLTNENIKCVYLHSITDIDNPRLHVSLINTEYYSNSVWVEDTYDTDELDGRWGSPGHYEESSTSREVYGSIYIPISALLQTKEEMIESLTKLKIKWDKQQLEKKRQEEIEYHKTQLAKLNAG